MSPQPTFIDHVLEHFAFLTDEFGFALRAPSLREALGMVHYERPPVTVDIGWYKGEVSVVVTAMAHTTILRPGRSKAFSLEEIAGHLDATALKEAPQFPGHITKVEEADRRLAFDASLLRKYGADILQGDLKILEAISLKRK